MPMIAPIRWLAPSIAAVLVLSNAGLADAQTREYRIDPTHSRVAFLVEHAGFSQAIGTFSGIHGSIDFDPDDWSRSRVQAIIPIASLDLGDADWNDGMLKRRFFHVERYAEAHFVSHSAEPLDDRQIKVSGELTIRGRSRDASFVATINADRRHPMTFKRTLGASARLEMDRADFGLGAYPGVVGATVEVLIELEAIRQPRQRESENERGADNQRQSESEHTP